MNSTHQHPRTPYHSLGSGDRTRIPTWATHRSVYRRAGRTLYLVETEQLAAARRDLRALNKAGWNVEIERSQSPLARISLTRRQLAPAA